MPEIRCGKCNQPIRYLKSEAAWEHDNHRHPMACARARP
jgi:hypothetical protein